MAAQLIVVRKSGVSIVVGLFTTATVLFAASDNSGDYEKSVAEVRNGLVVLRDALSTMKSAGFEGSLRVTAQEEFLKFAPPKVASSASENKDALFRIRELRQGAQWAMVRERLGKDGGVESSDSFFVGDTSMVHRIVGHESSATITPLKSDGSSKVPGNQDTALMIYAFLTQKIDRPYIPHLEPGVLASAQSWAGVLNALPSAILTKEGVVQLTLDRGDYKWVVDFSKFTGGSQRWPSSLKLLTKDSVLVQQVTVLEYSKDEKLIGIPKRMMLDTFYEASGKSIHVANWEFSFSNLTINQPIDQDALTFDPSSVDFIHDGANHAFIRVPK